VYCRECIYKYLLDQKQKLKRARKKYEEQLAELAEEATASQQAEEDRKLQACRNAVCVCVCVCVCGRRCGRRLCAFVRVGTPRTWPHSATSPLQEFIAANTDTASADVFRAKGALETLGDRETNQRLQKLEEESKVCVLGPARCASATAPDLAVPGSILVSILIPPARKPSRS